MTCLGEERAGRAQVGKRKARKNFLLKSQLHPVAGGSSLYLDHHRDDGLSYSFLGRESGSDLGQNEGKSND